MAVFKSGESEISIHYGGGNENRYVVDYKCVYICMHSLHIMYATSSLRFIAYYNLLLQDLHIMTLLLIAS